MTQVGLSKDVIVNNKSNFKSHLVKCQLLMNDLNVAQIKISAIGKATFRAVNLALQLNKNNHDAFQIQASTHSVHLIEDKTKQHVIGADKDLFDPDNIDLNTAKKDTHLPAINIIVRKSERELQLVKKLTNLR